MERIQNIEVSYGSEVTNYLFEGQVMLRFRKIHITRMATNQKSFFKKDKYYMDIKIISEIAY